MSDNFFDSYNVNSGYMTLHLLLSIFALYLAFRCNGEFRILPFLAAFFFPYLYIPYALAISCRNVNIFPR